MNSHRRHRGPVVLAWLAPLALLLSACTGDRVEAPEAPIAAAPPAPPPVTLPPPPPPPPIPVSLPPDASALPAEDREFLVARGLLNPEAELIADLRAHPELIPCTGAMGGTPGFHDPEAIRVVSRDRVEAAYDDGHRQGRLDLGFTVRGGKIAWKVEKDDCPQ